MVNHYLIRLDDACPSMDSRKWGLVESIMDDYGIKPLVGIVPANADPRLMIAPEDLDFWEKARCWEKKGWGIALHGYDHVYVTNDGGINPLWNRSEFAGLEFKKQKEKISRGWKILSSNGLHPRWFYAPSHTFDNNTLKAIAQETDIKYISDTIAARPYQMKHGIVAAPCQMGRFRKVLLPGYWTFCYHPNTMTPLQFSEFENFIRNNRHRFLSFDELPMHQAIEKDLYDKFLSCLYFSIRNLR